MQRTDFSDLADPEFAPIRAQLARAFMAHKADLGVAFADRCGDPAAYWPIAA